MNSVKIYNLDECSCTKEVLEKLKKLSDENKIEYSSLNKNLIKIKDISLSKKEIKDLNKFLYDHDVLEDEFIIDDEENEDIEDDNFDDDYLK